MVAQEWFTCWSIVFRVVWHEEVVPKEWREGLIVNLFKKGDKEEPGNYRGITLML